jgi:predicted nuclease of predicted toxin-antitoxin system
VIEIALSENRILLTEDKDFGSIVYQRAQPSPGVILVRRFAAASKQKTDEVVNAVKQVGETIVGDLLVVEPGRIRGGGARRR